MKDSLYVYIEDQALLILHSFLFGVGIAILYDAVRILRTFLGCGLRYNERWDEIKLPIIGALGARRPKKLAGKRVSIVTLALFDLLYMITVSLSVIVFMYAAYDGIVRSFSLISILTAFVLYMKTVGIITKNASGAILYGIRVAVRYIRYFTVTPIAFILKLLCRAVKKLYERSVGRITVYMLSKRASERLEKYVTQSSDTLLNNISCAMNNAGKNA